MNTADFTTNIHDVTAMVAMDGTGRIGNNGTIPWYYPEDLKRFKQVTQGGAVIMGRKTFESIPVPKSGGRKLPGRHVIVITRDATKTWDPMPDNVVTSVEDALGEAKTLGLKPWVIGGAEIYNYCAEHRLIDVWDLTSVETQQHDLHPKEDVYLGLAARLSMTSGLRQPGHSFGPGAHLDNWQVWTPKKVVTVLLSLVERFGEDAPQVSELEERAIRGMAPGAFARALFDVLKKVGK